MLCLKTAFFVFFRKESSENRCRFLDRFSGVLGNGTVPDLESRYIVAAQISLVQKT